MSLFNKMLKAGAAMKAFDIAKRELSKPENRRKAKALVAKAQAEIRKPENQKRAKDIVGQVTRRGPGRSGPSATDGPKVVEPKTLPPAG